jgi:hypothetical protein
MGSRHAVLPSCTSIANSKSGLGKAYQTSTSQAFTGFPLVTETALRLPSSKDSRTLRPSFISTSGTATAKASGEEGQETQCLGKRLHREPRPPSLQPTNAGPEVALFVPEDAEPNPARQQLRLRSFHAWKGRQARSSPTSDTDPIPESLPAVGPRHVSTGRQPTAPNAVCCTILRDPRPARCQELQEHSDEPATDQNTCTWIPNAEPSPVLHPCPGTCSTFVVSNLLRQERFWPQRSRSQAKMPPHADASPRSCSPCSGPPVHRDILPFDLKQPQSQGKCCRIPFKCICSLNMNIVATRLLRPEPHETEPYLQTKHIGVHKPLRRQQTTQRVHH